MSIDYTHCLRPQFSEHLVTHLLNNTSVNVIIETLGKEAERLVEDIQHCQLPQTQVCRINMRYCRQDFNLFLKRLGQECRSNEAVTDFSDILAQLTRSRRQFVIILNYFSLLEENNVDKQFDDEFYAKLNGLKNDPKIVLLIITRCRLDDILFNIGGDYKTSKLDIQEVKPLPALSYDEIRYELRRRHPELSELQVSHIISYLQLDAGYNYELLEHFSDRLSCFSGVSTDIPGFIKQLKQWQREYRKINQERWARRVKRRVDTIQRFFEFTKLPKPSLNFLEKIINLLHRLFK